MQKLAALEAEQQKLREEERKELEAQIAKVKNDANTSLADKDRKIAELNQQIADNIANAKKICTGMKGRVWVGGSINKDYAELYAVWDDRMQTCRYDLRCNGDCH